MAEHLRFEGRYVHFGQNFGCWLARPAQLLSVDRQVSGGQSDVIFCWRWM
jgi:hypothetical protein